MQSAVSHYYTLGKDKLIELLINLKKTVLSFKYYYIQSAKTYIINLSGLKLLNDQLNFSVLFKRMQDI